MTVQALHLQLPPNLYQQLVDVAEASHQSLTNIVLQSIRIGLPPALTYIPERFRADLKDLYSLSDDLLWKITQQDLTEAKVEQYEALLAKNQREGLTETEQATLDILRDEADLLMLRRSYSYALLKWRGHRIPTLKELQMP